jgi:hypothetical protein
MKNMRSGSSFRGDFVLFGSTTKTGSWFVSVASLKNSKDSFLREGSSGFDKKRKTNTLKRSKQSHPNTIGKERDHAILGRALPGSPEGSCILDCESDSFLRHQP